MVTPRSQRLTISKLVPTSSANFAWDHPLRLRACLKRSFGTRSSTLMMEAPSSSLHEKGFCKRGRPPCALPCTLSHAAHLTNLPLQTPVSSTTITLYLNSAINKRKIGRITKLVINKSRNCQTQVQSLSKTNPVRWRLLLAHSWYGYCQQARKRPGLAILVLMH